MSKQKKCAGKEGFERMNYLYQVSNALATENSAANAASVMYNNLLIAVSKKTVQRMDMNLKRTICKGCHMLLLAGLTAHVRVKRKQVRWKCLKCHTIKAFPIKNKDYEPWFQKKESVVEILDYSKG